MADIEIKGSLELEKAFKDLGKISEKEVERQIRAGAIIVQRSGKRKVPTLTTNLQKKISVAPVPVGANEFAYAVGTGVMPGTDVPYAAKQHEDESLNHPRGGEAKFLQKALDENEENIVDRVEAAIDKALREVFR